MAPSVTSTNSAAPVTTPLKMRSAVWSRPPRPGSRAGASHTATVRFAASSLLMRFTAASVRLELGDPVRLDLLHQRRRQRHVVERARLGLTLLERPLEEAQGDLRALRVLRLL